MLLPLCGEIKIFNQDLKKVTTESVNIKRSSA